MINADFERDYREMRERVRHEAVSLCSCSTELRNRRRWVASSMTLRRVARESPLRVNATLSMSTADDEPGAADGRKYGVPVRLCEKGAASTGLLESVNRVSALTLARMRTADTDRSILFITDLL
jgi:hypothetical protein